MAADYSPRIAGLSPRLNAYDLTPRRTTYASPLPPLTPRAPEIARPYTGTRADTDFRSANRYSSPIPPRTAPGRYESDTSDFSRSLTRPTDLEKSLLREVRDKDLQVTHLLGDKSSLLTEKAHLAVENEHLKTQVNILRRSLNTTTSSCDWEAPYPSLVKHLENNQLELLQTQAEKDLISSQLNTTRRDIAVQHAKLEAELVHITRSEQLLKEAKDAYDKVVKQLAYERAAHQAALEAMAQDKGNYSQALEHTVHDKNAVEAAARVVKDTLEKQISDLTVQLARREADLAEKEVNHRKALESLNDQLDTYKRLLAAEKLDKESVHSAKAEVEKRLEVMRVDHQQTLAVLQRDHKASIDALTEEHRSKLSALTAENQRDRISLLDATAKWRAESDESVKQLRDKVAKLTGELEAGAVREVTVSSTLSVELKLMQERYNALQLEKDKVFKALQSTQDSLSAERRDNVLVRAKLQEYERGYPAEESIRALREKVLRLTTDVESAAVREISSGAALNAKIRLLEEQVKLLQGEKERLVRALSNAQTDLSLESRQINNVASKAAVLESQNMSLESRVKALSDMLAHERDHNAALVARLTTLESSKAALDATLSTYRAQVAEDKDTLRTALDALTNPATQAASGVLAAQADAERRTAAVLAQVAQNEAQRRVQKELEEARRQHAVAVKVLEMQLDREKDARRHIESLLGSLHVAIA